MAGFVCFVCFFSFTEPQPVKQTVSIDILDVEEDKRAKKVLKLSRKQRLGCGRKSGTAVCSGDKMFNLQHSTSWMGGARP